MSAHTDHRLASLVDHARSLDCIHCGLCLNHCPTYRLTGRESAGPRGRIHLMRALGEGRLEPDVGYAEELEGCLVCRNCESVCPAGVEFGAMMEVARDGLTRAGRHGWRARVARHLGFRWLLPSRVALSLVATLARLGQRTGLASLLSRVLGARGAALRSLPPVPPRRERRPLPRRTPAEGEALGEVAVLEGCVMPQLLGRVQRASVRVLAAAGDTVLAPVGAGCCGALHAHNGDLEGARALARELVRAYEATGDVPLVVDSAGCGAHLKELGHLLADDPSWAPRAAALAARVRDLSQHLTRPDRLARLEAALTRAPRTGGARRVTYDDPCHLCHGQGVRDEPRRLLDLVPDLRRVELPRSEGCCGSAGLHSLLHPDVAEALIDEKLRDLDTTGADTLVTANPGCHLQWESALSRTGREVRVQHLSEVLARALGDGSAPS